MFLTPRNGLRLWVCLLALIAAIFSLTLTSSPPAWNDEVIIVEFGRVLLTHSASPVTASGVLGPLLHELAYRATAPSDAGPRIASCLAAMASSTFFLLWMLAGGVPAWLGLCLSLALLLDPTFAQSYRGARCDSLVFCFFFLALWISRRYESGWGALAAGASMTAAFCTWASALLLAPLLLAVWRRELRRLPWLLLGMAIVAGPILLTWRRELLQALPDSLALVEAQRGYQQIGWIAAASIFIVAAGVSAIVVRRDWFLGGALTIAAGAVYASTLYPFRALYLLPYVLVATALLFAGPSTPVLRRFWLVPLVAAAVVSGAIMTLGVRTVLGWQDAGGKRIVPLIDDIARLTGGGHIRAYLGAPELYFAGRALHWDGFDDSLAGRGLRSSDWAIVSSEDSDSIDELRVLGYLPVARLRPEGGRRPAFSGFTAGGATYGPYVVYRRP